MKWSKSTSMHDSISEGTATPDMGKTIASPKFNCDWIYNSRNNSNSEIVHETFRKSVESGGTLDIPIHLYVLAWLTCINSTRQLSKDESIPKTSFPSCKIPVLLRISSWNLRIGEVEFLSFLSACSGESVPSELFIFAERHCTGVWDTVPTDSNFTLVATDI